MLINKIRITYNNISYSQIIKYFRDAIKLFLTLLILALLLHICSHDGLGDVVVFRKLGLFIQRL